jgi:excisionase family DNA binding protein
MAVSELGPLLTASEVAKMLHLHVNTVKRLGDRGELPFFRVCRRGDRRFRLADVITSEQSDAIKAAALATECGDRETVCE